MAGVFSFTGSTIRAHQRRLKLFALTTTSSGKTYVVLEIMLHLMLSLNCGMLDIKQWSKLKYGILRRELPFVA